MSVPCWRRLSGYFNNRDRCSLAWRWFGRPPRSRGLCMQLAIRRFQQSRAFPFSAETPHRNKQVACLCFRSCGSLVPWRERFACMRRVPILLVSFSSNFLCGRHYLPDIRNQNRPRPRSDGSIRFNTDRAALCKSEPLVQTCSNALAQ
jgi:hypothetical protein